MIDGWRVPPLRGLGSFARVNPGLAAWANECRASGAYRSKGPSRLHAKIRAVLSRQVGVEVDVEVLSGKSRNLRSRIFLDALRMTVFLFWAAGGSARLHLVRLAVWLR